MRQWWLAQAARIDALSLRERGFLFFSLIVTCLAVADVLWLSPAMEGHAKLAQQFGIQSTEVQRLRRELQSAPTPVDVNKPARAELAQLQQQLQALKQDIALVAGGGSPALEPVLVEFLRRREGLVLLSTATLKLDATVANEVAVPGVVRRGLELKVAGSYAELVRYVKSLEQALPSLRWGLMQLRSEKQPPELTLQVYVLEVQP
jgi:MSHA biogenesis protein MshJ